MAARKFLVYLAVTFAVAAHVRADCVANTCNVCLTSSGCGWCPASGCQPIGAACPSPALKSSFNCPKNSTVLYDEDYVRNTVYPLVGATKPTVEKEILTCATKGASDVKHVQRINVTCSPGNMDPCVADVYVLASKRLIVIVAHGSSTQDQYLHQAQQFLNASKMMSDMPLLGGRALNYYANGFDSLYNGGGLKGAIQAVVSANPSFTLLCTGHSLGGALATVLAATVVAEKILPSAQLQLITFGSPRVGDANFGATVERLLPYRFRVVNQNDLVPEMPPLKLDDTAAPQHITFEVFYRSGMGPGAQYTVCRMNEDPTCRNGVTTSDLAVHPMYFNVSIDTWYLKGCAY